MRPTGSVAIVDTVATVAYGYQVVTRPLGIGDKFRTDRYVITIQRHLSGMKMPGVQISPGELYKPGCRGNGPNAPGRSTVTLSRRPV